ncbi:sulfite exporter TauE/SafE family protein [Reyranella sp.]|uniref:sulfite exporter TauE/SafE family protein n=1 Tax=Reyranella sp. TaxID=1929291 RepID=UPI003BA9A44D
MTIEQAAFCLAVFLLAGAVKGLVGLGLPTIVIALTTLFLPLTEAIAMIALPSILTNVWQAAVGGNFRRIVRRQWLLIVPLAVSLYVTMWLVGQKGPNWAFLVLAAVLIVYSGLGLFRIRLHIHADLERPLRPAIGVISGFVAGVVGVPIIPLMPYLQGLDIKPSELVQTLGVVLCATSLALTVSLLKFGLLDGPRGLVSAAAVVPALGGMWLGQQIRRRLSVEQFRLAVLWALLLTGLYTFASRALW